MSPGKKAILRVASALVLTAALVSLAQAQRGGRGGAGGSRPSGREADAQFELEREMTIRALEEQLKRPEARSKEHRLAFAQISEDFTRIQLVNNDLLTRAAAPGTVPDPGFVAKSTAEIKKLAGRLKENLVLPEPEKGYKRSDAEVGPGAERLKAALSALGKLVAGFAHNPIFKESNVVDTQLSAKARRDLEEIIALSDQIRKFCEKQAKAEQTPRR